ncbi:TGF-beta activated kinase 1 [Carabus blaptoides fortunei]
MAAHENEALSGRQQFVEEIDYNEIRRIKVVGKGTFGVVWKGKWRNIDVAVKNIDTESERKAFAIEVRQLSRVSHPNIVKLYGACTKLPNVCLVMEYAEGGSLYNVLHGRNKPNYTAAHAMSWALQCAQGVAYLHAMKPKPLIHRDLKPPNLLLVNGGTILKICDFGTAADKSTYMTNNKGSAAWMAPEVFESSSYTEKCDVFSWGIILWEVLSRKKPFEEIGGSAFRILWAVHKGQRPPLLEGCPPTIEKLMTACWDQNPTLRPTMQEVVQSMSELAIYFPGGDTPVDYSPEANNGDYDEDEEAFHSDEADSARITNQFSSESNGTAQNTINLPQPTYDMMTPLQLEVDPNAWDADSCDMEIRTMAGFDKMMPKQGNNSGQPVNQEASNHPASDQELDNMYMFLDPNLRPLTPDLNDPQSRHIFEEHKQLAEEYLKVQRDIALLYEDRKKLLEEETDEQLQERQATQALLSEKESLMKLYESLKTQLQLLQDNAPAPPEHEWVVVPRLNEESGS